MHERRREVLRGLRQGVLWAALGLAVVLPAVHFLKPAARPQASPVTVAPYVVPARPDFNGVVPSDDARRVATWAVAARDAAGLPFALIDKRDARLYVFDARGRLQGQTPILLGHAPGDDTVPGIGDRPLAEVRPEERTTPAGRFVSEPGRNAIGETVVWVDYDAAVSMHRVRTTNPAERRLERLASPDPAQRRISWGCINIPVAFFEQVVWPAFGSRRGVVYVLPEVKPLQAVFPGAEDPARHPLG